MKKLALCLLAFFFFSTSFIFSQYQYEQLLTVEQLKADLQLFRNNLEQVQPGLYLYTEKSKLDSLFDAIEKDLTNPLSSIDFYRKLLPLIRPIGNNHTYVICPSSYDDFLQNEALRFPFQLYFRADSTFVLQDHSNEQIIKAGTEIKTINGENASNLIKKMATLHTTDGYNSTIPLRAMSLGFSRQYARIFGCPSEYEIGYINESGMLEVAIIQAIKVQEIEANYKSENQISQSVAEKYTYEELDGIGYLTIKSFQPDKAIRFRKFIKSTFQTIKSSNLEHLIIDVRNNGGGYPEAVYYLMSYLIGQTIYPIRSEYALVEKLPNPEHYQPDLFFKHFKKQNLVQAGNRFNVKRAIQTRIKSKTNAFQGKTYILTNAASASATGEFTGLAKSYCNATFVGEEAGGNPVTQAANDLFTLILPHSKLKVKISGIRFEVNVDFENNGHGILPDYEILPSVHDVIAGKDVVLLWTLDYIEKSRGFH